MARFRRIPLVVLILHVLGLGLLYIVWRRPPPEPRPPAIRASLVALPQPRSAAAAPAAAAEDRPQTPAAAPASPPQRPRKKKKKKWRARTAAEIRRQADLTTSAEPPPSPRPRDTNWQAVQQNLARDLAATRVQVSTAGSTTRVPQTYTDKLLAILYQTWKQPTRAQVSDPQTTVRIQLAIERSGALRSKRIIGASGNQAMDGSVRRLLQDLGKAPPLPAAVAAAPLRLSITLVLRR